MIPYTKLFGILAAILATGLGNASRGADSPPSVYGLIIGADSIPNLELAHVAPLAANLGTRIQKTFGIKPVSLVGHDATLASVRKQLYEVIPALPPGSVVFVHILGHGERLPKPDGELFIRLDGAVDAELYANSVSLREILEAVKHAKRCNLAVFIDCCFSGEKPGAFHLVDDELQSQGVHAFVMASSSSTEQSQKGIFTSAIMSVWDEEGTTCPRPDEFLLKVQQRVRELSGGFQFPDMIIPPSISRCLWNLAGPSCVLAITFNESPPYPVDVYLRKKGQPSDAGLIDTVRAHEGLFYFTQVARSEAELELRMEGKVLLKATIDPTQLKDGPNVVGFEVDVTKKVATATPERAIALKQLASLKEAIGDVTSSTTYFQAAAVYAYLGQSTDNLLTRAAALDPKNRFFKLAVMNGENSPITQELLSADSSTKRAIAEALSEVGKYQGAATWFRLAREGDVGGTNTWNTYDLFKESVNLKLGGKFQASDDAVKILLDQHSLSQGQKKLIQTVWDTNNEQLRNSAIVLPENLTEWAEVGNSVSNRYVDPESKTKLLLQAIRSTATRPSTRPN